MAPYLEKIIHKNVLITTQDIQKAVDIFTNSHYILSLKFIIKIEPSN